MADQSSVATEPRRDGRGSSAFVKATADKAAPATTNLLVTLQLFFLVHLSFNKFRSRDGCHYSCYAWLHCYIVASFGKASAGQGIVISDAL